MDVGVLIDSGDECVDGLGFLWDYPKSHQCSFALQSMRLGEADMDETVELEKVIVHTNESLPVEFNPITHEVSDLIEISGGNMLVYVRPKKGTSVEVGGE